MMNRRNLTILALGAALSLALPVMALAQTSRVEGMALQGDYIKDYSGIYTYTSGVSNVGNLIYGELGTAGPLAPATNDRSVGAVLGNLWDGRFGTWAIHLREQTPNLGQGDASSHGAPGIGSDPNTNTNESFDLMWGKKFGTKSLGLRLNRSFGSQEFAGTNVIGGITKTEGIGNLNRNVLGFGGGVGFEVNPTTNVEMNVLWQSRTFKVEDPTVPALTSEEDGPTTYQVAGRAMWQWQSNVMVVPVVKFYSYDTSVKNGTPAVVTKSTLKGWQVGLAGNWALGTNDLFVLGATFARNKQEAANKNVLSTETFAPQVFAALETHLNSWLTVRFGANKAAWYTIKNEVVAPAGSTKTNGFSSFEMNLGAGLKFGNLQLDAILDNSFPHNLPFFVSGNNTANMFPKVTATYPF